MNNFHAFCAQTSTFQERVQNNNKKTNVWQTSMKVRVQRNMDLRSVASCGGGGVAGGEHSTKSFATELIQDKPEVEHVQENNSQILLFSIISYKRNKNKSLALPCDIYETRRRSRQI